MAGYQRFVAYVYEYRKGKKDGSSGYVRVEARDRRCLIEVHLRCVGLEPGSKCRVYGFVRREGLMDGILIGSCTTGRECWKQRRRILAVWEKISGILEECC